jgi:Protein of unknown function (DUF3667)
VSHFKERKYKNCLNCNARVYDKFCGVCGQENIEPQESVLHLLRHFFEDITHFDGKFFTSLKYLLLKPGFLTREYVAGRRMSYLNPVRFYIFTSFLFFLIVFSFIGDVGKIVKEENAIATSALKDTTYKSLKIELSDSDSLNSNNSMVDKGFLNAFIRSIFNSKSISSITIDSVEYRDKKQFDSLNNLGLVKLSYLKKKFINKVFEQKQKYGNDKEEMTKDLINNILHLIPQALLLSLPFFALLLKLLYIRRKKFYYVAHIIFTIHFYVFVYIHVLFINLISKIADYTNIGLLFDLTIVLGFGIFYYIYKAMRNFYEQSRGKTTLKLIILSFFLIFLFTFFLLFLIGFSFYKT